MVNTSRGKWSYDNSHSRDSVTKAKRAQTPNNIEGNLVGIPPSPN